jgi:hypothetical protein
LHIFTNALTTVRVCDVPSVTVVVLPGGGGSVKVNVSGVVTIPEWFMTAGVWAETVTVPLLLTLSKWSSAHDVFGVAKAKRHTSTKPLNMPDIVNSLMIPDSGNQASRPNRTG